jgi:hypothetical protein
MRRRQILVANAAVEPEVPEIAPAEEPPAKMFACECGREFAYQGSLNLHKRNCSLTKAIIARLDAEYGRHVG